MNPAGGGVGARGGPRQINVIDSRRILRVYIAVGI